MWADPLPGDTADPWLPARTSAVLEELMQRLEADPGSAPPHLFVVGPGGTGKSGVLAVTSRRLRARGHEVVHDGGPEATAPHGGTLFHVRDDVEGIDPLLATALTGEDRHRTGLIHAFAAGVDAEAASALIGDLGPHLLLELTHWDEDDIAEHLAATTRPRADRHATAAELHSLTGGFPWLVARCAEGRLEEMDSAIRTRLRWLSAPARRLVEELAFGLDIDSSAEAADSPTLYDELLSELELAGIMTAQGAVPPLIATVASGDLPLHRRRRLQRRALETLLSTPDPDPEGLRRLAASGVQSPELADALLRTSDEVPDTAPDQRAMWIDLAEAVGADPEPVAIRRTEVAVLQGRVDTAVQEMDTALSLGEASDPDRTVRAAAAAFMLGGLGPRAAQTCHWIGPRLSRRGATLAALVLFSQGDRETAEQLLASQEKAFDHTLEDGASSLLAEALRLSLRASPMDAIPLAARAAAMQTADHHDKLLPVHPAAIAAILALQVGDLATAQSVLHLAVGALPPGTHRHRSLAMLIAWTCMLGGDLASAHRWRSTIHSSSPQRSSRGQLWDVALGLGLARREHDTQAIAAEWAKVHSTLLAHPVDLFDLLALGEIHIAAVRARLGAQVAPHMRGAWTLLENLGNPPLWSTDLHWCVIQGAIVGGAPQLVAPHAAALVRDAPRFPLAADLAGAGKVWVAVLAGTVDAEAVVRAAHRLRDGGRPWDGQRLAGHAAARARDRRDASALLECARTLGAPRDATLAPSGDTLAVQLPSGPTHLSRREREVAELVVEGRTYKEIGAVLFLSERTIEHHIARVRTRFGVSGRPQLLEYLRAALAQVPPER